MEFIKRLTIGLALVAAGGALLLALSFAVEPLSLDTVFASSAEPVAEGVRAKAKARTPTPWTLKNFPGLIAFACAGWVALRLAWEGLRTIVDAFDSEPERF